MSGLQKQGDIGISGEKGTAGPLGPIGLNGQPGTPGEPGRMVSFPTAPCVFRKWRILNYEYN